MLLLRKPKPQRIRKFLKQQAESGFSYREVGATADAHPAGYVIDHTRIELGCGPQVFRSAKIALSQWKQFDLGWVEAQPDDTPLREGEVVAIVARSIRDDELLHTAAISEFGSWETALEYTGVRPRDVGRSRDLSQERIKHRLRRLCTTGYNLGAVVNRNRDRALYDAARRHFGGWRNALIAAGVNLTNVTRHRPKNLDREAMLLWIRNRKESGQSLIFSEVCLEDRDYALAIRREFRS